MQFSIAMPLTIGELVETCCPTITTSWDGAVAVMVVVPVATQVAVPSLLMLAAAVLDDFHVNPSATVSWRLVWLSKLAVAVNATVACELMTALAEAGLTTILLIFG